jgi:predicted RNA binding protein YcfA (HicA-like mRNA interferase family)
MPKLKQLSGADAVKILQSFGFVVVAQKGSHIKLVRRTVASKEVLTIPNHKNLKTGTTKAIFNQVAKYIPTAELQKEFYHE